MGDETDTPAYLTAIGVALLLGAAWAVAMPVDGLPVPTAPIAMLVVAAVLFAGGAAVKATEHR